MIPETTRQTIEEAMKRFDAELRETSEWRGWEQNQAYRYAIEFDGHRYPVKQIISMATGTPLNAFSGGTEANSYAEKLGLKIVELFASERAPACWIEKTLVQGRPDRIDGPHALAGC